LAGSWLANNQNAALPSINFREAVHASFRTDVQQKALSGEPPDSRRSPTSAFLFDQRTVSGAGRWNSVLDELTLSLSSA
jgi:hypothetical protein